jgi:Xaa-Pro aminopeptidase
MTTATTDLTSVVRERRAKTQETLRNAGIDALLLGPSADLFYLTGYDAHLSERLNLLVLPAEGQPSLVVPVLEAPLIGKAGEGIAIHTWQEHEPPAKLVAKVLGDGAGKKLAVGDQLWAAFLLRIQAEVPGASWSEGGPLMRPQRMIKDSYELAQLQDASSRTDEAWEEFIATQKLAGFSERQAMDILVELTAKRGLNIYGGICASGPNSASPHHHTGDRIIQQGDAVVFDWGGSLNGYKSDVTRTVHIGDPSEEYKTVYGTVLAANQEMLNAVKPGVECQQLDRVARRVITEAGYGPAFLHRVGHGLGLDVHEEPYLVEGNTLPLAAGMVFSDEPGIYLEGKFGVRIEDTVVCTEDGGRRLNEATRALTVME